MTGDDGDVNEDGYNELKGVMMEPERSHRSGQESSVGKNEQGGIK